jgi:hypothetical protein
MLDCLSRTGGVKGTSLRCVSLPGRPYGPPLTPPDLDADRHVSDDGNRTTTGRWLSQPEWWTLTSGTVALTERNMQEAGISGEGLGLAALVAAWRSHPAHTAYGRPSDTLRQLAREPVSRRLNYQWTKGPHVVQ